MSTLLKKGNIPLVLTIIYCSVIFAVSSIPGEKLSTLPAPDYIMHTIEYTGLGILLCWWRLTEGETPLKALLQAVILGCLYGMTDEFHQYFVPGRSTSATDWLADTVGTTAGASIMLVVRYLFSRFSYHLHLPDNIHKF